MLRENFVILKGAISQFHHTGCLWGSSPYAAATLTAPMQQSNREAMNILEVGAGTGAVTMSVIEHLQPGDSLTICEINEDFMAALKKRLEKNATYQAMKENISFYSGPIQDYSSENKFDFIVCALPFLNFDVPTIKEIFAKLTEMCNDGSLMTYFEYIGIRPVSKFVSPQARRKRIKEIEAFFKDAAPPRIDTQTCWLNLLPMNVYTLNMAA